MSETLVVKMSDAEYDVFCLHNLCADLHGAADVGIYPSQRQAEQAARAHRMADRNRQEAEDRRIAHCCRTCGQPVPVRA